MKELFYFSLICALFIVFAGCSLTEKVAEKASEEIAEKTMEAATGSDIELNTDDEELTITTDEGDTVTMGEDVKLPSDFPSDVPIYEDATISSAYSLGSEDSYSAGLTSTDDLDVISAYYESEMDKQGWTIEYDSTYAGEGTTTASYTATKDSRTMSIGIYDFEEGEVTISISVSPSN